MRYSYHVSDNKVFCIARYAGKIYRGVAKCDTEHDEFNIDTGIKLAKLRCDAKIATKRMNLAKERFDNALLDLLEAQSNEEHRRLCYEESIANHKKIQSDLTDLEIKLKEG